MRRIWRIISAKYLLLAAWWQRNIGPSELLGLVSVGLIGWGLALMYFPLCPVFVGMCGAAVSIINARMR